MAYRNMNLILPTAMLACIICFAAGSTYTIDSSSTSSSSISSGSGAHVVSSFIYNRLFTLLNGTQVMRKINLKCIDGNCTREITEETVPPSGTRSSNVETFKVPSKFDEGATDDHDLSDSIDDLFRPSLEDTSSLDDKDTNSLNDKDTNSLNDKDTSGLDNTDTTDDVANTAVTDDAEDADDDKMNPER